MVVHPNSFSGGSSSLILLCLLNLPAFEFILIPAAWYSVKLMFMLDHKN